MKQNVILEKTVAFSVRISNLEKYLRMEKREYEMSKQLLRCGTSIGANAHEAHHGQSRKDFLAKMYIAFKETAETEYWLTVLTQTDYLTKEQGKSMMDDCLELKRILASIIKTTKEKEKERK